MRSRESISLASRAFRRRRFGSPGRDLRLNEREIGVKEQQDQCLFDASRRYLSKCICKLANGFTIPRYPALSPNGES